MKYWGMCAKAVIYLINRLPSSVLMGKVPFRLLHNIKASLLHLRILGYLCCITNLPKEYKFAERATTTVMMGYSETQKGYILLDLHTKHFFTSRDVVFKESEFPFPKENSNVSKEPNFPMSFPLHMEELEYRNISSNTNSL